MPDVIPSVPWRWVPSPNHDGPLVNPRLVIVHCSRSGQAAHTPEQEYQAMVAFAQQVPPQNPAQVGPHFVAGPSELTRMVHDAEQSWCTGNQAVAAYDLNQESFSVEMAQATRLSPIPDGIYRNTADLVAHWCVAYNIPAVHLPPFSDATGRGILGHDETRDGRYDGKTDPGPMWDWGKFITLVQRKVAQLTTPATTIPQDVLDYAAAHSLGTVRVGPGLSYTDEVQDGTYKTTTGAVILKRHFDPPGDLTVQIDHVDWKPAPSFDKAPILAALAKAEADVAEAKRLVGV